MAESKVSKLLLLTMAMAAAALFACSSPAGAYEICGQDVTGLIFQCQDYVKKEGPKVAPSAACCGEVQKLDVVCVCKNFPPFLEQFVSMAKVVYVARTCGKTLPSGTKCGSYVAPPAWRSGRA